MAKPLVSITTKFEAFWNSVTLSGITRKVYHPDLGSIQQLPLHTLIFTWDKATYDTVRWPSHDSVELRVLFDAMVLPGTSLQLADDMRLAIQNNVTLDCTVLCALIESVDFGNPAGGMEGVSGVIVLKS